MSNIELPYLSEVVLLVLAGTDFAGIRHHAVDHGWQVGAEELHQYVQAAHKRLARTKKRGPIQFSERALGDRSTFDHQSLKTVALQRALEALGKRTAVDVFFAPPPRTPPSSKEISELSAYSRRTRRQRVVRQLVAEASGDASALKLLEYETPQRVYHLPDTMLPIQLMHIMALIYLTEQLDQAAMVTNALFCSSQEPDDEFWDWVGFSCAYRFRVGKEGWQLFTKDLGIDGDYLLESHHQQWVMLTLYGDKVCDISPTLEELQEINKKAGRITEGIVTAEDLAKSWRDTFLPIFDEAKRSG